MLESGIATRCPYFDFLWTYFSELLVRCWKPTIYFLNISRILKLVLVPVLYNSRILKMVLVSILKKNLILKLVLVPVLKSSCILKLVLVPDLYNCCILKLVLVPVLKKIDSQTGTGTCFE